MRMNQITASSGLGKEKAHKIISHEAKTDLEAKAFLADK